MLRDNWDGTERRAAWDGIERRRIIRYEENDGPVVERERYVEHHVQPPRQVSHSDSHSSGPKWLSPNITMPIIFAVVSTISGFVFNLYDKVTALEFKQISTTEKFEEVKHQRDEMQGQYKELDTKLQTKFKEYDTNRQKMDDHINSVEETVLELYRRKQ